MKILYLLKPTCTMMKNILKSDSCDSNHLEELRGNQRMPTSKETWQTPPTPVGQLDGEEKILRYGDTAELVLFIRGHQYSICLERKQALALSPERIPINCHFGLYRHSVTFRDMPSQMYRFIHSVFCMLTVVICLI